MWRVCAKSRFEPLPCVPSRAGRQREGRDKIETKLADANYSMVFGSVCIQYIMERDDVNVALFVCSRKRRTGNEREVSSGGDSRQ
jgi:hypothetical protein